MRKRLGFPFLAAIATLLLLPAGGVLRAADKKPVDTQKTWTKEDLEALEGGISFLGEPTSARLEVDTSKPQPEEWWRNRSALQASRLADVDAKLAQLETQRALAVNPYTRALARSEPDEAGNTKVLTPAEIQAQIDKLRQVQQAELRGVRTLREAAESQGIPPDWIDNLPADDAASEAAPKEPPLFIRPDSSNQKR